MSLLIKGTVDFLIIGVDLSLLEAVVQLMTFILSITVQRVDVQAGRCELMDVGQLSNFMAKLCTR